METGDQREKEFRVIIIKMMKELGRRMDAKKEKSEVFNTEFGDIN